MPKDHRPETGELLVMLRSFLIYCLASHTRLRVVRFMLTFLSPSFVALLAGSDSF